MTPGANSHGDIPVDVAYLASTPKATAWTHRAQECQLGQPTHRYITRLARAGRLLLPCRLRGKALPHHLGSSTAV